MRGDFLSSNNKHIGFIPGEGPQGLTQRKQNGSGSIDARSLNLSMRVKRLKLSGKVNVAPDMSTRKQVGEAEAMLGEGGSGKTPWWRNVSMEEGM
jgi:ABC-type glutathione transport system ATPase component